ncbi:hypothetical protein F2Q68_00005208 [Brassica cretica]|uniref:Uncharacterized protein n=1 Tax=Brassica cretica TaxID=69181 RepID=A0A8S9JH32_BRACR|nr:hypothetical protein F2Q68_00005208 [Brassica cretica]
MRDDYDFITPDEFNIFRDSDGHAGAIDGRILQVSREDIADILQVANGPDNLFMQQRNIPDNNLAVPDENPRANTTGIGSHQSCRPVGQASIDKVASTSLDRKIEYGVYRDESGYARSVAGEMIHVTKDNIRKILERASLFEESHICLPEHATSFTPTRLAPEIYTKDEINEMVIGICGAQEKLGDELKTLMMNVQRDIGKLNDQHDFQEEGSTSIDRFRRTRLDGKKPIEHLPYTAATVDHITSKLYTAIDNMEERFEKRCDDIYFPFDVKLSGLDSQAEWLQKEVKAIQRKLASQHQISASIDNTTPATSDRHLVASIDSTSTPKDEQLIQNKMESMQEQLNKLSAYAYSKIGWYQFSIEDILERLQNISNAVQKMDERWTRNDEATRNSTKMLKWINLSTIHTYLDCLKEPKLTSNTKPDITACLGAWYTWDRILQTSLEGLGGGNLQGSLNKEFLDIGQKEVNRIWWQPPLSLDSWKSVQSWSLILQRKQALTQVRN